MVFAREAVSFDAARCARSPSRTEPPSRRARCCAPATGVSYRLLRQRALGAHRPWRLLRAPCGEAHLCRRCRVYIVGAANSAGQAALNLARSPGGSSLSCVPDTLKQCRRTLIASIMRSTTSTCGDTPSHCGPRHDHLESLTLADHGNEQRRECRRAGSSSSSARPHGPTGSVPTSSATTRVL